MANMEAGSGALQGVHCGGQGIRANRSLGSWQQGTRRNGAVACPSTSIAIADL